MPLKRCSEIWQRIAPSNVHLVELNIQNTIEGCFAHADSIEEGRYSEISGGVGNVKQRGAAL